MSSICVRLIEIIKLRPPRYYDLPTPMGYSGRSHRWTKVHKTCSIHEPPYHRHTYAFTQRSRQLNIFFATTSRSPHLPECGFGHGSPVDSRTILALWRPTLFHEVTAQPYYKWLCAERVVESQVATNVAYKVYIIVF